MGLEVFGFMIHIRPSLFSEQSINMTVLQIVILYNRDVYAAVL